MDKLLEFINKDLNIKYDYDTNVFDNKFHHQFDDTQRLYNINIDGKEQNEVVKAEDLNQLSLMSKYFGESISKI